jgi:hypothetical protein
MRPESTEDGAWGAFVDSIDNAPYARSRFLGQPSFVLGRNSTSAAAQCVKPKRLPAAGACGWDFLAPLHKLVVVHATGFDLSEALIRVPQIVFNADPHIMWSMAGDGYAGNLCWEEDEKAVAARQRLL